MLLFRTLLVSSNGVVAVNGDSFSGLTAGNYQIILIDANSCSDTVQIKLKEPSLLNLNFLDVILII